MKLLVSYIHFSSTAEMILPLTLDWLPVARWILRGQWMNQDNLIVQHWVQDGY